MILQIQYYKFEVIINYYTLTTMDLYNIELLQTMSSLTSAVERNNLKLRLQQNKEEQRKLSQEQRKISQKQRKLSQEVNQLEQFLGTSNNEQSPIIQRKTYKCVLHICIITHICKTCDKSICMQCILTNCKIHQYYKQADYLAQKKQKIFGIVHTQIFQIQQLLQESKKRQSKLQRNKLDNEKNIKNHFDDLYQVLQAKKEQIVGYYHRQFRINLQESYDYDQQMLEVQDWMKKHMLPEQQEKLNTFEKIDHFDNLVKFKLNKLKQKVAKIQKDNDKMKGEKLWGKEKISKILNQISKIQYIKSQQAQSSNQKLKKMAKITSTSNLRRKKN